MPILPKWDLSRKVLKLYVNAPVYLPLTGMVPQLNQYVTAMNDNSVKEKDEILFFFNNTKFIARILFSIPSTLIGTR
jgi:hypothetical protein